MITNSDFKITVQSSKTEEVEYLTNFVKTLHPQSYLGNLFTDKLVEWVTDQIKKDGDTDLFNEMKAFENKGADYEVQLANLRNDLELVKAQLGVMTDQKKEKVEALCKCSDLLAQEQEKAVGLKVQISNREQVLIELKAKLYDLTQSVIPF